MWVSALCCVLQALSHSVGPCGRGRYSKHPTLGDEGMETERRGSLEGTALESGSRRLLAQASCLFPGQGVGVGLAEEEWRAGRECA